MLPKVDSEEWISMSLAQKLDLINEILQSLAPKEEPKKKKAK